MSELDEKLDRFIKSVDLRLGEIERQLKEQRRADERISEDFNLPPNLSLSDVDLTKSNIHMLNVQIFTSWKPNVQIFICSQVGNQMFKYSC